MNRSCLFMLVALLFSTNVKADVSLVLARAPQLSPGLISELWAPFVKHLSETTGIRVTLKVYSDRTEFERDIKKGNVDLYFGNPGYGVLGKRWHDYIPLIRSDKKLLKGIIVTRKDSEINSVEQLNGELIAFPASRAFAATLCTGFHLRSVYNINYDSIYTGSHDSTYRAVLIGKAAAGGGVIRTLEREDPKIREQLKIIYTTPGMSPHPLMVHPKVPEGLRLSIQQAILNLDDSSTGKAMLASILLQEPVIPDYTNDYQDLEQFAFNYYQSLLN